MNKERRKQIDIAKGLVSQAAELIEQIGQDEQEYADNIPEAFQGCGQYDRAEEVASEIEYIASELAQFVDELEGYKY